MVDPAIRRAARMELARREFWSYCKLMAPDFYREDRPYLKELCTRLQAFCESDRKVLVVNMPYRFLLYTRRDVPPLPPYCLACSNRSTLFVLLSDSA